MAGPTSGDDEVARLAAAVRDAEQRAAGSSELADLLCRAFVASTSVDGAALTISYNDSMAVPVGASDPDALQAERVQFTLGQGPCYEALRTGRPVLVADVTDLGVERSYDPGGLYAASVASTTPWRLVAATPMDPVDGMRVALLVFCRRPLRVDDLPSPQVRDAAVALVLGALRRSVAAGPPAWLDAAPALDRGRVWVAEEAVALAGGSDLAEALVRMRGAAFSRGATLDEVAADLVEGRLAVTDVLG